MLRLEFEDLHRAVRLIGRMTTSLLRGICLSLPLKNLLTKREAKWPVGKQSSGSRSKIRQNSKAIDLQSYKCTALGEVEESQMHNYLRLRVLWNGVIGFQMTKNCPRGQASLGNTSWGFSERLRDQDLGKRSSNATWAPTRRFVRQPSTHASYRQN